MLAKTAKTLQDKPQSRLYKLEEAGFDPVVHDASEEFKKKVAGLEKAQEWGDRIPIGVFYKNELKPTFQERFTQRIPFYTAKPASETTTKRRERYLRAGS